MSRASFDDGLPAFHRCEDCQTTTGEHLAGCPSDPLGSEYTPADADRARRQYERRAFESAMDTARATIEARATLEERAKTDPAAAREWLQYVFRRFNEAVQEGTERERDGWRGELRKACAQYNALTGRTERTVTTREAVA